jgi:hypothetical protein
MSSELTTRMEAIKASLAAFRPQRVVTRDAKDPSNHSREDRLKGIFTIVALNEGDYTNAPGYLAQDGRQGFVILGDIDLVPNQAPSKIEDAEGLMLDDIKAWVRSTASSPTLCLVRLIRVIFSGQIASPSGWIVCELDYKP